MSNFMFPDKPELPLGMTCGLCGSTYHGMHFCSKPAAPSPALTREALLALVPDNGATFRGEPWLPLDAILAALGTPPPAPTSTREETP